MLKTRNTSLHQFPLNQDGGQTYLSWAVGFLSIIIVFMVMGFLSVYDPDTGSNPTFTVEIPLIEKDPEQSAVLLEKVSTFLKTIPSLQKIEVVERSELINLLGPLANDLNTVEDLPLPILIDVTLDSKVPVKIKGLTQQLRQIAAGIHVEPYAKWHSMVQIHNRTLQTLVLGGIILILMIMMALVSLVTRTSLTAYRSIVDILRLMGARNTFIARQFQNKTFLSCLKGSFIGLVISLVVLYCLSMLPPLLSSPLLFEPLITFYQLPFFLLLPLVTAIVSAFVSYLTVLRLLHHLEQ
ncbi:cell division protein FtsX [Candidatus Finniella inopinata]|uniref:FtsX-like permease family protein n=1 Tax=Candidatus Finniella inopinata TaxID=1696036 RepID=A0A4Q7DJ89_9PROT|nr:FtsX-like permease family protein [Candidatus Finniella inopinata]RZI47061.1 FtsX-like permease family protein [Candidatus Finniella inopinata]